MAKIKGELLATEISEDGTTWKDLICLTSNGSGMTRETTTAPRTFCDSAATGQEVEPGGYSWEMNFDAMTSDTVASTEVTYKELAAYFLTKTKLYTRRKYDGTSGDFTISGRAYLTELTETSEAEGWLTFSGKLTGTGDITIA